MYFLEYLFDDSKDGWYIESDILRHATQEEINEFEIQKTIKKYNI